MKLGARIIPTMAVAFFLVPALFADDTPKSADTPKKDESVNSPRLPTLRPNRKRPENQCAHCRRCPC